MPPMGSRATRRAKTDIPAPLQEKLRQGVHLHQQGKLAEAEKIYQEVLQLSPDVAAAHINLGSALIALARFAEALPSLDKAIALKPDFAEAYTNRAAALNALNRHDQALASCDTAIALKPNHAEAHNNRADALNALKRHQDALESCDKAIALKESFPEAHNNRGNALNAVGRHDDAIASYNKAIALRPGHAEAHNNRGNAFYNLGRAQQALASYDQAIALKPAYAEAHNNRGNALSYLKQCEAAIASYDKAIALNPGYVEAQFNKSLLLLLMGRFEQGWPLYEWRKRKAPAIAARVYPQPAWLGGESLAGKTILLHEEQGLGDTIQFCRYAPLVAGLAAKVILEVPPQLTALLAGLSGGVQIVHSGASLPDFDVHCPLLSLPLALKTGVSNIPADIPYLAADPAKSRSWTDRLGEKTKRRVGLVWSGGIRPNQPVSVNRRRNIPLARLAALRHPAIEFYSLQKGQPGEMELAELKRGNWDGPDILDYSSALNDFSDTAALMDNLDLIITVDTATAHLAGALGKPVWILNRFDTCWRWFLDRTDSPWYPTAALYRQETDGDWDGVIARIATDLMEFAA